MNLYIYFTGPEVVNVLSGGKNDYLGAFVLNILERKKHFCHFFSVCLGFLEIILLKKIYFDSKKKSYQD